MSECVTWWWLVIILLVCRCSIGSKHHTTSRDCRTGRGSAAATIIPPSGGGFGGSGNGITRAMGGLVGGATGTCVLQRFNCLYGEMVGGGEKKWMVLKGY